MREPAPVQNYLKYYSPYLTVLYHRHKLDLLLSISHDIVSTNYYDKRDDLDFEIVNFPF